MRKILFIIIVFLILSGCGIIEENSNVSIQPDVPDNKNVFDNNSEVIQTHNIKEEKEGTNWECISGNMRIQKNLMYLSNDSFVVYNGIYLDKGNNTFSFNISEYAVITIKIYDDNGNLIYDNVFSDKENIFDVSLNDVSYFGKIELEAHDSSVSEIAISDFCLSRPTDIVNIHVNQVGYNAKQRKVAVFPGHQGNYFYIKSAIDNSVMAIFGLSTIEESLYTDEYVSYGDFSDFEMKGEYYLESSFGYKSFPFIIDDNIYSEVLEDILRSFTIQRCGMEIGDEISKDMSHAICHQDSAYTYYYDEFVDVIGGWHDAGDYGRYVDTAFKALSDMILAYIDNEIAFNDETNVVDSHNNKADLLDEIKYELDWLMKLQEENGGVHSTVSSMEFADFVTPDKDNKKIILFDVSPISTAEFSAVAALASHIFKDIDEEYSQKCLSLSEKAFNYARYNTNVNRMPGDYHSGQYSSTDLNKYMFYAGVSLWYTTDNTDYYKYAMSIIDMNDYDIYTLNWCPLLLYPTYLILNKADETYINYYEIEKAFFDNVNYTSLLVRDNPYRNNLTDILTWGSNQYVADNAMMLMMAYNLSNDLEYYDNATELIDYIFGKNCLNKSFVTGYGYDYPQNIHHRTTISKGTSFKGVMVGGPNMSMEDNVMKKLYSGTDIKPQWMYIDDKDSFSTNETAIQYNSSLIYILSSTIK